MFWLRSKINNFQVHILIWRPVFFFDRGSYANLPNRIVMRDTWMELNGTFTELGELTVENGGKLYIWSLANTKGKPVGEIHCINITVKAGGKFEPLTAVDQMKLVATRVEVKGYGYMRTNNLHLKTVNLTIDQSGKA